MYCKSNFNHKGDIFKRFVKTCPWSSQIFFASLPYGSYNKTSVYKSLVAKISRSKLYHPI